MPETFSLPWKRTKLTNAEVVYEAGQYKIVGTGFRGYGGALRRTWKLFYNNTLIGEPGRLSEAKRDADYHRGVSR